MPLTRSETMARVKSTDTSCELVVRKTLFSMGYRYRLHGKDLPGKPDIIFRKQKKAIFVNGCFWHRHEGCKRARIPKSNREYWQKKLSRNVNRDKNNYEKLKTMDWRVLVIWECETKDIPKLKERLSDFLCNDHE